LRIALSFRLASAGRVDDRPAADHCAGDRGLVPSAKRDLREGNAMTIVKHSIDAETAEKAVAGARPKAGPRKQKN
jgi:hypothetical protein